MYQYDLNLLLTQTFNPPNVQTISLNKISQMKGKYIQLVIMIVSTFQLEVKFLKKDIEQLVTQYDRDKQLRKANEQSYLEIEDQYEKERTEMTVKLDSLSSIVKMLELKARNYSDQITRLEDKEAEMKKEYSKLRLARILFPSKITLQL